MSRTAAIATTQPHAGPVAPHLQPVVPRDPQHAAELAGWSRLEGFVRAGREACERGERIRELRAIRAIRDEALALAGYPL